MPPPSICLLVKNRTLVPAVTASGVAYRTCGGMADVASDVGVVGAYEDMASWVTVALENAGKQYL